MSRATILPMFAVLSILSGACGSGTMPVPPPIDLTPDWVNTQPQVLVASPSALAVGDSLTLVGKDFIDPANGQAVVSLQGVFYDEWQQASAVDLRVPARRNGPGRLSWRLWPDVVFHPAGNRLGSFVGEVRVINQGSDGSEEVSDALPVEITIKPSIIVRVLRPKGANCRPIVPATLEDKPMVMEVETVGLREASGEAPITFYWSFQREHWNIGQDDLIKPDAVLPTTGGFNVEDRIAAGTTSRIEDDSPGTSNIMRILRVGTSFIGNKLTQSDFHLRTALIDKPGKETPNAAIQSYSTSVNVAAVDASGKSASLQIPLGVTRPATLFYDKANTKPAERQAPMQVSGIGCIQGQMNGDGTSFTYRKDQSKSVSMDRGITMSSNLAINVGFVYGVNFSNNFGVDYRVSANASESMSQDISTHILPGMYGTVYVQAQKIYRFAEGEVHNECGEIADSGTVMMTDWVFNTSIVTGATCPPEPTGFQPAERLLPSEDYYGTYFGSQLPSGQ